MNIYQVLSIGQFHTNHCEDYLVSTEIGKNKRLLAVLDGCSMGNESHFASTLTGKLLKKIALERFHLDFRQKSTLEEELKEVLKSLFTELKEISNKLLLQKYDLLTTLILCVVDTDTKTGEIIVIGDGLINVNGKITEFDQQNTPDYLGYHLNEDFETWFNNQKQKVSFKEIKDISIATDGIFTFEKQNSKNNSQSIDIINYFLFDLTFSEFPKMLENKLNFLSDNYGLKPNDDLAIIRLIV